MSVYVHSNFIIMLIQSKYKIYLGLVFNKNYEGSKTRELSMTTVIQYVFF